MTNGDKIRSMTDEQLAGWIDKQHNQDRDDWESPGCYNCVYFNTHHYPSDCGDCGWKNEILNWLKQEFYC